MLSELPNINPIPLARIVALNIHRLLCGYRSNCFMFAILATSVYTYVLGYSLDFCLRHCIVIGITIESGYEKVMAESEKEMV